MSLIWLSFGLAIGFTIYLVWQAFGVLDSLAVGYKLWSSLSIVFQAFFLVLAAFSFFFVPFLLALPFALFLAAEWRDPYRIALLRPFQRLRTSKPLSYLVRHSLSGFGHVYTLSDADIRTPWYIRVPVTLGQVTMFGFRFRVQSAACIDRLERAMGRRVLRNLNWCMTPGKVFAVRCSDSWWQTCVEKIVMRSHIVLLDVSGLKQNVLFELDLCVRLAALDRLILLCGDGDRADLAQAVSRVPLKHAGAVRAYEYDARGRIVGDGFNDAVARTVAGYAEGRARWARVRWLFVPVLLPVTILFATWHAMPYVAPGWVARHSPFAGPVVTVYVENADVAISRRLLGPLGLFVHSENFESELASREEESAQARNRIVTEFGASAVGALQISLESSRFTVRGRAARALAEIDDPRVRMTLLPLIADEDYEVRSAAASGLARVGVDFVPDLVTRISNASALGLQPAIDVLARYGDARASAALVGLLDHDDVKVRDAALRALERCGDEQAATAILDRFKMLNADHHVGQAGSTLRLLANRTHGPRMLEMLGEVGENLSEQMGLEKALDAATGRDDTDLLVKGLSARSVVVRRYVAERLAAVGSVEDLRALRLARQAETNFFVRTDLDRTIERLSPPATGPGLVQSQ